MVVVLLEVNSLDGALIVKEYDTRNSSCGNLWLVDKDCFSCVPVEDQWHLKRLQLIVDAQWYPLNLSLLRVMDCLCVLVMEQYFHYPNELV